MSVRQRLKPTGNNGHGQRTRSAASLRTATCGQAGGHNLRAASSGRRGSAGSGRSSSRFQGCDTRTRGTVPTAAWRGGGGSRPRSLDLGRPLLCPVAGYRPHRLEDGGDRDAEGQMGSEAAHVGEEGYSRFGALNPNAGVINSSAMTLIAPPVASPAVRGLRLVLRRSSGYSAAHLIARP